MSAVVGYLELVEGFFKPLADIVEHLTVSGDQKAAIQQTILRAQFAAASQAANYEQQLLEARTKIILAEAQGGSWIQRNWRPITMLTFLVLVVGDALALLPNRLAPEAWELLKLGLGGYVIGRSAEKIAVPMAQAVLEKVRSG